MRSTSTCPTTSVTASAAIFTSIRAAIFTATPAFTAIMAAMRPPPSTTQQAAQHGTTWLFGILTFRTVTAALAFFGLCGLAAQAAEASTANTLLVAAAGGATAMAAVYWMMRGLRELGAEGTVRIQRALGQHGSVYLRIPGNDSGSGKIQINLQNRTMDYLAVTSGPELPTGTKVVVVGIVNPTTLEVRRDE